ncbi:MAG: AAA family ATPase [Deltaproteobacteria bacterium]|nr:AAA family ATPase [Deltaproteobacteria bacterium]
MDVLQLKDATPEKAVRLGRYSVVGTLGVGGMGDVFEAIDEEHGGRVALKTLRELDPDRLLLFKNEFRAVAGLFHPNLVPLYELSLHEGLWFFTMERVEGIPLPVWLRRSTDDSDKSPRTSYEGSTILPSPGGTDTDVALATTAPARPRNLGLPPITGVDSESGGHTSSVPGCDLSRLESALAQLLDALEHLHAHGVVHQDLKPNNVIVEPSGVLRLLDFGLVTAIGQRTRLRRENSVIGTPAYMSPEQWGGRPATPASDLFSLGCVIFQSLTGQVPFPHRSASAGEPPRVERLVRGVPSELAEICWRLLRSNPDSRPSIREIREALRLGPRGSAEGSRSRLLAMTPSGSFQTGQFVGRAAERDTLLRAAAQARGGANVVVQVTGFSGVGKSALVRSVLDELRSDGSHLVLRGRCYERESVPYKAFDGMMDDLALRLASCSAEEQAAILPYWFKELTAVFPALSRVPAPRTPGPAATSAIELKRRVLGALCELIARMAARHPIALEIDDLQWADDDSVGLLSQLLATQPRGLLSILEVRPEEASSNPKVAAYLERVLALPLDASVRIPLGPLDRPDAEHLARRALHALGLEESLAPKIASESAGIPYFLEELAHSVARHPVPTTSLATLDQALMERVGALPELERALVEVLAVANNPIPLATACRAAGLAGSALQTLRKVHRGHFIQTAGMRADDLVTIYHDRMRESVLSHLPAERAALHHLALGRALTERLEGEPELRIFDAVRHLGAAAFLVTDPAERSSAALLHLQAGCVARKAAAFPLAFQCFEAGITFLAPEAFETEYECWLGLHVGAAEAAYLSSEWATMERRIAEVKAKARTLLDQLTVFEVQIDACAGRHRYPEAIQAGLQALELFGVHLPATPTEAEVSAAFQEALAGLNQITPEGLAALPDAQDPEVVAAMRIQVRLSPAAYFARPMLLPLIACNLISTSIERGLSPATPNALALFGIILNAAELFPISHVWGELAIRLIDRWEDRSLEAATRHVVFNLVCTWMRPLSTVLASSLEVFDIGRRTGDLEYGSYAAHTYVYLALYCGRPLGPLLEEALQLGRQMRALGQINAVHVHEPFEQLLKCLTGAKANPWSLDDAEFQEKRMDGVAEAEGSRSGLFILRKVMGMARFYAGRPKEASRILESARPYMDAAPSCWLIPVFHQFAAMAALDAWGELSSGERAEVGPKIEDSVGALRRLAKHSSVNFAHRVSLLEGELARVSGDPSRAIESFRLSLEQAKEANWVSDMALAHERLASCYSLTGKEDQAAAERQMARDIYGRWGARTLADRLAEPQFRPPPSAPTRRTA